LGAKSGDHKFLISNQKPDRIVVFNSTEKWLKVPFYSTIMTEKTQLSEKNIIFVKNKLHAQFSLGAKPQNGNDC